MPAEWRAIRDRWEFYHGLRTLISIGALACLFASTLSIAWRRVPIGGRSGTGTP